MATLGDDARRSATRPGWLASAARRAGTVAAPLLAIWRRVGRLLSAALFSSLIRRIIFLNLVALAVLVIGILYLNSWRAGLIEARVQSLRVQGEIIAAAVAASATVDSDVITVNPDRLLEVQGLPSSPLSYFDPSLEFPISPERVAPLLGNLITPTRTRARIYDQGGLLILDSDSIYARGELLRPRSPVEPPSNLLSDIWTTVTGWLPGGDAFPLYQDHAADEGMRYPEVKAALSGAPADIVRVDAKNRLVVSVAVPVQRQRATVGALLLSTAPGDIDQIVSSERWGVVRIALVAAFVNVALSFFLAASIAGPIRRLASAAEQVQTTGNARAEIPDFTDRPDEIGHLSRALRQMTDALYTRIEAIERFAADVAHELKNPLTSLRSAVETLPRTGKAEDRERLTAIIQHDVRRLDRLISDISNASRLDAELARESANQVDLGELTETMVSIQRDVAARRGVSIALERPRARFAPLVVGHDSRLAQVISNLIDNAVSFSPDGGEVRVDIATGATEVVVTVTDSGPGIRGDITRIFQRFYTDRPDGERFGDHSGLGLSISRQIVVAHKGTITARNREDATGAIFTVTLPRVAPERPAPKPKK